MRRFFARILHPRRTRFVDTFVASYLAAKLVKGDSQALKMVPDVMGLGHAVFKFMKIEENETTS